jgi:pilus assembly protein CpaB
MQNRLLAIAVAIVLAIVAAMALVIYANSADRRAINQQAPVVVWVAAREIAAGETIDQAAGAGKIKQVEYPRRLVADDAVRGLSQLSEKVAAVKILPGEQLLQSRWVARQEVEGQNLLSIKQGYQALSVQVDAVRQVSGFIAVNNHINLYLDIDQRKGGGTTTKLLLYDVKVLAVGQTTQAPANGQPARTGNLATITLEVADKDVPKVVFAQDNGRLYLTLIPPNPSPNPSPPAGPGRNIGNLFD